MSISLHCESCKKKIKAPDEAGGKWGNCPHCKHRNYIPLPKPDDEPELRLVPLDESEETQMERLISEKEIIKECILYLRQMADGELGAAEYTFSQLKKNKKPALRVLASMGRAEQPEPELADLPSGILQGLIRDVATKLS
ncbi:MAG: hypothetical protein ACYTFX_03655 [Planctomycetota bacterium]|jgi:hypothetical protein